MIVLAMVFFLIYAALILVLNVFDKYDKELITLTINKIKTKAKIN
jgi:hypothetical protein